MIEFNKSLVKGSAILLVAFGFYNVLNFLYQFFMARMLSVSDYGILASIFSILYIMSAFTESIQTVITKYSAGESKAKLKNILKRSLKKAVYISSMIFLVFLGLSIFLSGLMKIEYYLLAMSGLMIFTSILLPVTRGVLQGERKFFNFGGNMIIESLIKLLFGAIAVLLGWKVYGALAGAVLGGTIAFLFSLIDLKPILKTSEEKAETNEIYDYAKPTFFVTFLVIVFYSIDVIVAKICFSNEVAGAYALASVLGKVIFWGTLPVSKAMFPMTSDKRQEKKKNILVSSVMIVLSVIAVMLAAFYFFPEPIIKLFSGKEIQETISILFYVGAGMSLISLTNLVLLYNLSVGRTKKIYWMVVFIFIEIMALSFFSSDLVKFSFAFMSSAFLFLLGSLFFWLKDKLYKFKNKKT